MANELRHGITSLQSGALEGAQRFASGEGDGTAAGPERRPWCTSRCGRMSS